MRWKMMQKIVPHLWFDKEAKEAAGFYTSVFPDSEITYSTVIKGTPSGDCDIVGFRIMGYQFAAISAGPPFKFNPSISFHARCRTAEEVDSAWEKLSEDGKVLMELGEYPFSRRYGWVQDRFGLSWQVIFSEGDYKQRVMPALMFTKESCGRAEEALGFYSRVFHRSKSQVLMRYGKGEEPDKEGAVKYAQLTLEGEEFGVMESARNHDFAFNEAISFIINCKDQKEIDYFWGMLSAVPEAEQCGWVKDKFGVSWQITPESMSELMGRNPEKTTPVMLRMKKIIIEDLRKAGGQ
jgi:predicted 3-demethylubiquinone-9 3-methyltransferase (glyoxalase superfamily)